MNNMTNIHSERLMNLLQRVTFHVLLIACLMFGAARINAGDLCLIYGGPGASETGGSWHDQTPMPWRLMTLDTTTGALHTLLELTPDSRPFGRMNLYPQLGAFVIHEGEAITNGIIVVDLDSARILARRNLDTDFPVWHTRVLVSAEGALGLRLEPAGIAHALHPTYAFMSLTDQIDTSRNVWDNAALHLAGPGSAYCALGGDIAVVIRDSTDHLACTDTTLPVDLPILPDSAFRSEATRGWTLIAANDTYLALIVTPYTNGMTERELLLYNREREQWSSLMLPGGRTLPRIINNRLAGVIQDVHPETDVTIRKALPAIRRESAVIIDPLAATMQTVRLGADNEILWLETGLGSEIVYYRLGNELYRGEVEGDKITFTKLLSRDPQITNIHWACRRRD